jgi:SAM-dependent methyltransferase
LDIEYKVQNFLELDYEEEFDVVLSMYCELGALTNNERDKLLKIINRALKPGGKFIFDVFTANNREQNDLGRNWEVTQKGFWDKKPYLSLNETFFYPEADTYLNQIIVVNEDEEISLYRVFEHFYNKETITKVLNKFGFINPSFYSDLTGQKYTPGSKNLAVVTEKL